MDCGWLIQGWLFFIATCLLVFGALCFFAGYALSYPENIRMGYSGCASCHVSPTGGGVLTNYGRTTAQEMSTWGGPDDSQLLQDWFAVGGDSRYIRVMAPGATRNFVMQQDAEVAVRPGAELWLDASIGYYGPDRVRETRRSYVLWSPSEYVSMRAGRFFPAYGIMGPDHTTAVRQGVGFDEGAETYNGELSVHSELGELVLTDTFSGQEQVTMDKNNGYRIRALQPGFAARATWYAAKTASVGASYWYHSDQQEDTVVGGPFALWGITRSLYLLGEADQRRVLASFAESLPAPVNVSWAELGYEAARGMHLRLTHEYDGGNRYGAALDLLPFTHTELLAQAKWQAGLWQTLLMAHWNW